MKSDYLKNDEFFINSVNFMQKEAWKNSENHGWDEAIENPASALMMITREVRRQRLLVVNPIPTQRLPRTPTIVSLGDSQ